MKNPEKEKLTVNPEAQKESKEPATPKKAEKSFAEKKAEFAKLISGEYKEVFEELLKEKTDSESSKNAMLRERLRQTEEILDMLSDRYQTSSADGIRKALKEDNSLFSESAGKYGMDVKSYRYMRDLERENSRARAQIDRSRAEADLTEKLRALYSDSASVSQQYPEFNLAEEIINPEFIKLIKSGVDMKTAYEVIHHNDILELIKRENAAEAKKNATMELEARNNRPVENGLASQSSALLKKDVSMLTPEERAEIARRAARGEIISF